MSDLLTTPFTELPMLSRANLLLILRSALEVKDWRFARQAALAWLAYYPGDLPIRHLYARALAQGGQAKQSYTVLAGLCQADPEDLDVWKDLAQVILALGDENLPTGEDTLRLADCYASLEALGCQPTFAVDLPAWAEILHRARQALVSGDLDTAESLVHQALLCDAVLPLVAVTHLQVAVALQLPAQASRDLASLYTQRFPTCLAPILLLANTLVEIGETDQGVALLHRAATFDVTGQVAMRLWGAGHRFGELWPDCMEAPLDLVVPAQVAVVLGCNRLTGPRDNGNGHTISQLDTKPDYLDSSTKPVEVDATSRLQPDHATLLDEPPPDPQAATRPLSVASIVAAAVLITPEPHAPTRPSRLTRPPGYVVPETLRSVQEELERVAASLKREKLARADGRFPVYVILTTRTGLERQYGVQGAADVEKSLNQLRAAIAGQPDWGAILFIVDDPDCMATLSLEIAQADDPWSIKLALSDLDQVLAHQGEMIGALIIVGGPEIVPFHHLPNPVDDADLDVPSDNPYATRDENYFIPEWPVGRLPDGGGSDPQFLIDLIHQVTLQHPTPARQGPWIRRWWSAIRARFSRRFLQRPSWGYTAAVWRRASLSVFRPIGDPGAMYVSPPIQAVDGDSRTRHDSLLPPARLGYFNLHGLQDASEWYGQRDPSEPADLPDYPVALRPQDVVNGGRAPLVVFSEACYGANVFKKNIEQALALKFLASGSQVVVGSTCTAYGSITTPLIAGDLLGHSFWRYLREGFPAGEALRRAKIHVAREMHRRQGYLDGEDQKTLVSFVLYGDPLAQVSETSPRSKRILRPLHSPAAVKIICDRQSAAPMTSTAVAHTLQDPPPIDPDTLDEIKHFVEQYLPGMIDACMSYTQAHLGCSGEGHTCPSANLSAKSRVPQTVDRSVVTLSKQIAASNQSAHTIRLHQHFARLTLDSHGKVVKVAVSR